MAMEDHPKGDSGEPEPAARAPACPDPQFSMIKHPLQHRWSLWFYRNDKNRSWEENLLEIASFDAVEDFWALYNHIEVVSKLPLGPVGCDYSLFKSGIKPMWEDCRNKQGGRWLFNLNKNQRTTHLDNYWLEILLCLIGEGFDEFSDDVNGAVVQVRNNLDKIAVWTTDVRRADGNVKIGKTLKARLNMHPRHIVPYQAHIDTQSKHGSTTRARYQV
ncbi:eukaryotic translation initiation factor 4E-like [Rhipicephalus sanguineus]|uniref:eukaryotic translation initiation factor 4E-like n=1 Tax=Rhipicephalus sanguineus TaxID=34632 RepID=UPI0020C27794|nr:eukaryotic translation initiation factor 4E-like [Rhipicephalus sanguineus]